jgi:hypothetical protein
MRVRFVPLVVLGCVSLGAAPAWAQDEEEAADETPAEEAPAEETAETPEGEATPSEAAPVEGVEDKSSPIEKPGETYRFVGLRYRGIIVPKFMMNLFGDGGRTVYIDSIGPEFAIRKDKFEYIFSASWADYGMEATPFKASSDPDQGWEHVESELWQIMLIADFLWSAEISPEFSFNYGLGAGFGLVFGDLLRSQVRPGPQGVGDPETYVPCTAVDADYCNAEDPFNREPEPSWANGGSKPIIFPWLAIQTGFRVKPHRNFVGRIDLGFGTSGFFFGLGADYGL